MKCFFFERIEIPLVDGHAPKIISTEDLCQVIEPRVTELFELVRNELQGSRMGNAIASGIVITGGTSMMKGIPKCADETHQGPYF